LQGRRVKDDDTNGNSVGVYLLKIFADEVEG
jgi:hypothetical protein